MKSILFVVLVLGFAVLGSAQTAAPTSAMVTATSASRDGNFTHMRGGVQIVIGTIRVTADEADANLTTHDFELRGNVHLLTGPNP